MTSALKLFQGRFGRAALLDSDQDLVMHTHPQCHVLIKADGADTRFLVRDREFPLDDGTMVLVNAWEPHAKLHPAGTARSTVLALYIEPEWLAGTDRNLGVAGLQGFFPSPCVPIPAPVRSLADRLVEAMHEATFDDRRRTLWENALFELMMSVIYDFSAWRSRTEIYRANLRRPSDPRINRALGIMQRHIGTRQPLNEIARSCSLSRPHFFHLFRECTTVSPAMYLNTLRMEAAFGKLPRGGASINELAGSLGFSEPQHFTRFFRQNLGIPPSEYRRRVEPFA